MPNNITVLYFASLAETANKDNEVICPTSTHLKEIYAHLKTQYGFELDSSQLAVAINHELCSWETPIATGDTIAFIPPVAGG